MSHERHPAVTKMRQLLIEECREKNGLDPREYDIRGDYHVSITLTVDEIRAFLISTAINVSEASPEKKA